jgi:hypothetical protein
MGLRRLISRSKKDAAIWKAMESQDEKFKVQTLVFRLPACLDKILDIIRKWYQT